MSKTGLPPASHFDYEATEASCPCRLCGGYRRAKTAYLRDGCLGHYAALRAAAERREIYSEMSFALTWDPKPHYLAVECLKWLYGCMIDPDYRTEPWWILDSGQLPLRAWIEGFQQDWGARHALSADYWAVSGIC